MARSIRSPFALGVATPQFIILTPDSAASVGPAARGLCARGFARDGCQCTLVYDDHHSGF
jgi:hypothetical protein